MLTELAGKIDISRVHFTGKVPYETYTKLLQRSDAHVYLTYPFVASWSLREALAIGCPVIGGDTETVREFVTHGENGLLTPSLEPHTLAQRILALVDDKSLTRKLRTNARAYAEKRLAMTEKMLQKLPMHVFARAYVEQTLLKQTPYARREKLAQQIAMVSSDTYIETLRTICRDDVSSLLTRVVAPTAVLNALYDASVPRTESNRLTAGIRGAIERTLPGVAHLACVDAPNVYVEAVLEFLDQHRNEDGPQWNA